MEGLARTLQHLDRREEALALLKELLETRIRPAVAGDGGDIAFRGYRDGVA